MRWPGHVAHVAERRVHTGFWWGNEGKNPLGRPRIRWEDNIKWAFKSGMGVWTGLIWLRVG